MEQPSGLRVSHEAIYTALYALPRGELRRELLSYLRQAKAMPMEGLGAAINDRLERAAAPRV